MTVSSTALPIEHADLACHVRPGDTIAWGQGSGEPVGLVSALVAQRDAVGPVRAFTGFALSGTFTVAACDRITPVSFGALGTNAAIARAGRLELLSSSYTQVEKSIRAGRFPVDVVFVQVSPPGPDGRHSYGLCCDTLPACIDAARTVIAELNPAVPFTPGTLVPTDRLDAVFLSEAALPELPDTAPGETERAIARRLAERIPDGATLQFGIGTIPAAIIEALGGHRDLGLHSGLLTQEMAALVEAGVITNARKRCFPGTSVFGVGIGGAGLRQFLDGNAAVSIEPVSVTHGPAALSRLPDFISVNSALEVDLYGQANAEMLGSRYVGAIGGQVDYMHAASASETGFSVIALPATTGRGESRIVAHLSGPVVTTARACVDIVVTEYGIADLRGLELRRKALALAAIAAPEHREALVAAASNL